MDPVVLYEASFQFRFAYLVPLLLLVFIAFFPLIMKVYRDKKGIKINMKIVSLFCTGCFLFVAALSALVFSFQAGFYQRTVGAYKRGEYQIIEGYVEHFEPMPYTGHSYESFDICGVSFFYSDYDVHPGYNNTKSHGGVITGNGQHLRIGYVYYDETYGNVIVYIEELP